VWNFGYSAHSGKLIIYEIAPNGQLRRQTMLDAPQADMVHDFAITENYLIFLLMPLIAKPGRPPLGSLDRYEWQAQSPLLVMLVNKSDFSVQRMELPNGGVFHLGNAWEEKGLIRLGYARYTEFLPHLKGLSLPNPTARPNELARWTQVEINLTQGTARQSDVGLAGVEFPRFDARFTGLRNDLVVLMQNTGSAGNDDWGMDSVLTHRGENTERYRYGSDWIAEEHVYVPAPGSNAPASGWVLGTALHKASGKTTLSVFEANAIAKGPVAQLALPFGLPLGLHGQFVAA
jgi:carotenoid cleavage dioxygenase-like enzyme